MKKPAGAIRRVFCFDLCSAYFAAAGAAGAEAAAGEDAAALAAGAPAAGAPAAAAGLGAGTAKPVDPWLCR